MNNGQKRLQVYNFVQKLLDRNLTKEEHKNLRKMLISLAEPETRIHLTQKAIRIHNRRINLMAECPFCYWCGRALRLYDKGEVPKKLPDDFPTIDHLNTRFKGERPDLNMKEETWVIACPKCNNERSKNELRSNKFRQWWKSGSFPFPFRWFGHLLKKYRKRTKLNQE